MSDSSLQPLLFPDLDHELATTRRVLERIPDEHLAWKPHPKSTSLAGLGTHLANLVRWQVWMLRDDVYDVAANPVPMTPAASRDALLATFDANVAQLRTALAATSDEFLDRPWTLRNGEHVIFTRPRTQVLRSFGLSHMAHHRGQLTVYLRLLDVPLPSVYGPTADER